MLRAEPYHGHREGFVCECPARLPSSALCQRWQMLSAKMPNMVGLRAHICHMPTKTVPARQWRHCLLIMSSHTLSCSWIPQHTMIVWLPTSCYATPCTTCAAALPRGLYGFCYHMPFELQKRHEQGLLPEAGTDKVIRAEWTRGDKARTSEPAFSRSADSVLIGDGCKRPVLTEGLPNRYVLVLGRISPVTFLGHQVGLHVLRMGEAGITQRSERKLFPIWQVISLIELTEPPAIEGLKHRNHLRWCISVFLSRHELLTHIC